MQALPDAMANATLSALDSCHCPQCQSRMQPLALEGHYGQTVQADLCPACHLVWFDAFESVRLSGLGWVSLLRHMQAAGAQKTGVLAPKLNCPRCAGALTPVHNLTRFGRFAALECARQHGHLQTFSLLLAERGLVRPLSTQDLKTLASERRSPCCLNCGAAITPGDERCSHCDSPLVVIDMPRLMSALLIRHAEPLTAERAQHVAWPCRGCGAALEPTQSARCGHCQHQVVVPSFVELTPLLDTVEPLLRAALPRAARPHGEKLRAMRGDARSTGLFRAFGHWRSIWEDHHHPGARLFELLNGPLGWLLLALLLGWWWL